MKSFVYGATGKVSGRVAADLVDAGVEVVAGSRNPEKQKATKGLEWVKVELDQGVEHLKGVDRLFLLSPPGYHDQDRILLPWVEAAKNEGLKKVVLMTAMGVDQGPQDSPFRKVELALIKSGLKYEIIRPNWFFDNFHTFWISGILNDAKIYFPGGDAKASFIDSRDIGDVIAAAMLSDETGKERTITGPRAVSHADVAAELSKVTGKKIDYVDISPDDFRTGLVKAGLSAGYAEFLTFIAGLVKLGYSEPVTNEVETVLGRAPIDLQTYAADHAKHWL